jgi:hypothetical protein
MWQGGHNINTRTRKILLDAEEHDNHLKPPVSKVIYIPEWLQEDNRSRQ